ncbi:MAG: hypothetical protein WAO52_04320 [Prolixibacteraceae bacterium]
MHKRNRNSIFSLVIIHLLLLVYPLVSKIGHVHHDLMIHHEHSGTVSFEQPEEICAVCDFEFFYFVPASAFSQVIFLKSLPIHNSPEQKNAALQIIHYFSLRAPPVA